MNIISKIRQKIIFNFTSPKKRFTEIYRKNFWTSEESISGPGSELSRTVSVRKILPEIIKKFEIKSILDIPCGDYHWMQHVDLKGVEYIGADIVSDIVIKNRKTYQKEGVSFIECNLIEDDLPKVDLIFSRDCFIHFSYSFIDRSIKNIKKSGAKYLLTNTFPDRPENMNIKTGMFRTLDLQKPPFNLPKPIYFELEEENSNKENGRKLLALWDVSQL